MKDNSPDKNETNGAITLLDGALRDAAPPPKKRKSKYTTAKDRLKTAENETDALLLKQGFLPYDKEYSAMLSGGATNTLQRLDTRKKRPKVDALTGAAKLKKGEFELSIEKYDELAGGLRVSTHKLLSVFTIALTKQNHFRTHSDTPLNTRVQISIDDFMTKCGIPKTKGSYDNTRVTIDEDLETLFRYRMSWREKKGRSVVNYTDMRLIGEKSIHGGVIEVAFWPLMAEYLINSYIMMYPLQLLKVDERNPISYHLGVKLALQSSITKNQKRGTHNIISVKSLLEWCEDIIPTEKEVRLKDRAFGRRIIDPFEKALDKLVDKNVLSSWHYCNAGKEIIPEEDLPGGNMEKFAALYILFEMHGDNILI